jgi:hypothetical protein
MDNPCARASRRCRLSWAKRSRRLKRCRLRTPHTLPGPIGWRRAQRRHAEIRRRFHAARLGRRPARVRPHRAGRHRNDRLPPPGDGARCAHESADGSCRRARGRLAAGTRAASAGGRGTLRQPGHRRLAQHAPFLCADASLRCRCASDARASCRGKVGGPGQRGRNGQPRSRTPRDEPPRWIWRARRRCVALDRSGARDAATEDARPVPLYREG